MSRQESAAATREDGGALRKLGRIPCLAFAVGTMLGGGVFTLSGTAINNAGPSAILSYLGAGVVMASSALSFVAISGRAKSGDSGYGPIGDQLGPPWRFVAMWGFYLNGLTILTFLVVSFGEYRNQYFLGGVGPIAAALFATVAVILLNLGPTAFAARHVRRLGEGRDRSARLAIQARETPLANALSVPLWGVKGIVRTLEGRAQRAFHNDAKQSGG